MPRGPDRHRQRRVAVRPGRPRHLARRPRRRARGHPVVDDDARSDPRAATRGRSPAVGGGPAVELDLLGAANRLEVRRRSARSTRSTSSLTTTTPPSPSAPMASSGWNGTPILRTRITSSGASSAAATSKPTATPPRGRPRTTGALEWPAPQRVGQAGAPRRPGRGTITATGRLGTVTLLSGTLGTCCLGATSRNVARSPRPSRSSATAGRCSSSVRRSGAPGASTTSTGTSASPAPY